MPYVRIQIGDQVVFDGDIAEVPAIGDTCRLFLNGEIAHVGIVSKRLFELEASAGTFRLAMIEIEADPVPGD